tara:strand:- start:116 stop:499 length:384 start_codon:yes stop_codon:yes gene_type:complete
VALEAHRECDGPENALIVGGAMGALHYLLKFQFWRVPLGVLTRGAGGILFYKLVKELEVREGIIIPPSRDSFAEGGAGAGAGAEESESGQSSTLLGELVRNMDFMDDLVDDSYDGAHDEERRSDGKR